MLFDVSVQHEDLTLNGIMVKGHYFVNTMDFSRLSYCFQAIHNLIKFCPKNVLRTFASHIAADINTITQLSTLLEKKTFLDYIICISSLYVCYI